MPLSTRASSRSRCERGAVEGLGRPGDRVMARAADQERVTSLELDSRPIVTGRGRGGVNGRPRRPPTPGRQLSAAAVLALMYALGGAFLLLVVTTRGVAFALWWPQGVGGLQIAAAMGLWLTRHRVGRRVLHVAFVGRLLGLSLPTAVAPSPGAVALAGVGFVGLALFAALFFRRCASRVYTGLLVLACLGDVLAGGAGRQRLTDWMLVSVAVIVVGEVTGALLGQLRRQASVDELTRLANRASFYDAAAGQVALAERNGTPLCLVLLDLDDFKRVNDTLGHLAGDALLAELAGAWLAETRAGDVLARIGGDEFALLLPSTTTDGARHVLERLGAAHPARWSAGVAGWSKGASLDDLLRDADEELYAHKAAAETRDTSQRST